MCGRFTLIMTPSDLAEFLGVPVVETADPRYNIAPTQSVWAVRHLANEPARRLDRLQWGLIPHWAKDAKIGARLINARVETLDEKPSFRQAFQRRRCLIPSSGFFEWQTVGRKKQPYFIHPKDRPAMAFAGLWETWRSPSGELLNSCAIITTEANEGMKLFHHRMPVILSPDLFALWLQPVERDSGELMDLLASNPTTELEVYPVGLQINNARNEGPDLLSRLSGSHV